MPAPRHLRPVARPRAAAEGLFHRIRAKVEKIAETLSHPFEEITDLLGKAQQKYLVSFSIFQSIPDAWSIDPVFPAAPLSRHGWSATSAPKDSPTSPSAPASMTAAADPDTRVMGPR